MRNTNALRRKIDRMIAALPAPATYDEPIFDYSVFSEAEYHRFLHIHQQVLPMMIMKRIEDIPDYQFFEYTLWLQLYKALLEGDEPRIQGYRYRLSFTTEQVIALFLSLSARGESPEELSRYTPYGLVYSYVAKAITEGYTRGKYRYIDEIWHWCVNAGLVKPLYHEGLRYGHEYPYRIQRAS